MDWMVSKIFKISMSLELSATMNVWGFKLKDSTNPAFKPAHSGEKSQLALQIHGKIQNGQSGVEMKLMTQKTLLKSNFHFLKSILWNNEAVLISRESTNNITLTENSNGEAIHQLHLEDNVNVSAPGNKKITVFKKLIQHMILKVWNLDFGCSIHWNSKKLHVWISTVWKEKSMTIMPPPCPHKISMREAYMIQHPPVQCLPAKTETRKEKKTDPKSNTWKEIRITCLDWLRNLLTNIANTY